MLLVLLRAHFETGRLARRCSFLYLVHVHGSQERMVALLTMAVSPPSLPLLSFLPFSHPLPPPPPPPTGSAFEYTPPFLLTQHPSHLILLLPSVEPALSYLGQGGKLFSLVIQWTGSCTAPPPPPFIFPPSRTPTPSLPSVKRSPPYPIFYQDGRSRSSGILWKGSCTTPSSGAWERQPLWPITPPLRSTAISRGRPRMARTRAFRSSGLRSRMTFVPG